MPLRTSSRISAARILAATLFLSLATTIVHATPVVILSPTYPQAAAEVDGIVVNGIDYNVRFDAGSDFTFEGQLAAAYVAANELFVALNASPATSVLEAFGPIGQFYIQEGATGMGPIVKNALGYGYGQQGAWQVDPNIGLAQYFGAKFTPVSTTPEPSSLILLGTGAAALAGATRRRKSFRT